MLCFRDITFCNHPACDGSCGHKWTPELAEEAQRWWAPWGIEGDPPVAFTKDFKHKTPKKKRAAGSKAGSSRRRPLA